MEDQAQNQAAMTTVIQLNLTLAEVNGVLQAMHEAPYKMAKPLIDKVQEQAQAYVNQMAAQTAYRPPANEVPQGFPLGGQDITAR